MTARQRKQAVRLAQQAAVLGLHHREAIHYTQGSARWQGIDHRLVAINGSFPHFADCSSFVTWCYWNALKVKFGLPDIINGQSWRAGFTGTMMAHGWRVSSPLPGDAVMYGPAPNASHTALYTGGGLVVSHGSEAGPLLLPVHYRADVLCYRRFF